MPAEKQRTLKDVKPEDLILYLKGGLDACDEWRPTGGRKAELTVSALHGEHSLKVKLELDVGEPGKQKMRRCLLRARFTTDHGSGVNIMGDDVRKIVFAKDAAAHTCRSDAVSIMRHLWIDACQPWNRAEVYDKAGRPICTMLGHAASAYEISKLLRAGEYLVRSSRWAYHMMAYGGGSYCTGGMQDEEVDLIIKQWEDSQEGGAQCP